MNKQELETLKDKHALGKLSKADESSLERRISQDPTLQEDLDFHKKLSKAVKYAGELELKDILKKIHLEESGEISKGNKRSTMFYYVAGFLLCLCIASYFIFSNKAPAPADTSVIYADFYKKYDSSLLDRGVSMDEAIASFNTAYSKGKYQEALVTIKPFLTESDNEIKLIAALAANETNDLSLAESLLDSIIKSKDFYFEDHAIWYKALIKLKTNDITMVRETLLPLSSNPKADHHNEAKELLNMLKG